MTSSVSRREFVETTTGLVIAFALPWRANAPPGTSAAPFTPNAWLRIGTDGIVTLTLDKSEMGQGSQTGLAMILAEELEADWSTVRLGPMPENPAGWSRTMRTGGSNAIRSSWEPLRKAGATARAMLVTAAAQAWKVDRATCRAERGAVIHVPSGRRLSYGTLAARAAALPVPTDVPLKDPKDFRLVGTRMTRLDTPSKVDGSALFGIDVKMPGMLVASIERSPVLGGRLKRFNADRGPRRCSQADRRGVRRPLRAPRHHGADELHGARPRRRVRRVGSDPESGRRAARGRRGVRTAEGESPDPHDALGRRVRTQARAGLRLRSGAGFSGGGSARQGDLDPRRRHAQRVLPPHELQPVRRGTRSRGTARRLDSPRRRHTAPAQVRTARKGDRRQSGGRRHRPPVCDTQRARGSGDAGSTGGAPGGVAVRWGVAPRVPA